MKTDRGIYYDLNNSTYIVHLGDELSFCFSSEFYMNNFLYRMLEELDRFDFALENIYKSKFNLYGASLALIRLYEMIEKRGFLIYLKGVKVDCLNNLEFEFVPRIKN